jgi:hypothetical protein
MSTSDPEIEEPSGLTENANLEVYKALKGDKLRVTAESFASDYGMWEKSILALHPYDIDEINEQLENIDVDEMPELGDLNDADIYEVYRKQHKTKKLLMTMRALIEPHAAFNDMATKLLKDLAGQLFEGTVKDKEAQAANVVKEFIMRSMQAKGVLKRIDTHIQLLDFSSQQVTRAMRDSQQTERLNIGAMDRARTRDLSRKVKEQEDMYAEPAEDGELDDLPDLPSKTIVLKPWSAKGKDTKNTE